ncbi:MAG: DUF2490 domain-containing protein [Parabacteroides sp.]|nr:DUF2490 domain-containing protein [Parabacteroides sp.]
MNKTFIIILAGLISSLSIQAQSLQTSAGIEVGIVNKLNGFVEGEYRTLDGVSGTERWEGALGLEYKVLPYLKLIGGYVYIHQQRELEITKKGNIIPAYWQPKHRAFFAVTGSYQWERFTFSLRERYQYTYRTEQYVAKLNDDGITPKEDEWVEAKGKHILRSRLEVEYHIKKTKFTPYAFYEVYNSFSDGFSVDKSRYTIGAKYKFNKKHSVQLYYRYIDKTDDDEAAGHIIGIGYKFKLKNR